MTDMTTTLVASGAATISAIEEIADKASPESRNAVIHGLERDIKLGQIAASSEGGDDDAQRVRLLEALRRLVAGHSLPGSDLANLAADPSATVKCFIDAASACSAKEHEWLMKTVRLVHGSTTEPGVHGVTQAIDDRLRALSWA
jgi:hypothetical protein